MTRVQQLVACVVVLALLLVKQHYVVDSYPLDYTSFFPSECPTSDGQCCPMYNEEVCGGAIRGSCSDVVSSAQVDDFITEWLTPYYTSVCVCNWPFWGAACESCDFGRSGDDCMTLKEINVRRNMASLTAEERAYVIDVFVATKLAPSPYQSDLGSYDWFAGLHFVGETVGWAKGDWSLIWHRYMLLYLERLMQEAADDDTFALPYWSWDFPSTTVDAMGGNGLGATGTGVNNTNCDGCYCPLDESLASNYPFVTWHQIGAWGVSDEMTLGRNFQCDWPSLPIPSDVDEALAIYNYSGDTGFQQTIGVLHAHVHEWISGTMITKYAASDPIFFLHHTYLEQIFTRWIVKGWAEGRTSWTDAFLTGGDADGFSLEIPNMYLASYYPLRRYIDVWTNDTATSFGYVYDYLGSAVEWSQSKATNDGDNGDSATTKVVGTTRAHATKAKATAQTEIATKEANDIKRRNEIVGVKHAKLKKRIAMLKRQAALRQSTTTPPSPSSVDQQNDDSLLLQSHHSRRAPRTARAAARARAHAKHQQQD